MEYDEFFNFMVADGAVKFKRKLFTDKPPLSARHNALIRNQKSMAKSTKHMRQKRIAQKTAVLGVIKRVELHIKGLWKNQTMQQRAKTTKALFAQIDMDGGGTIDKTEFEQALGVLGFHSFSRDEIGLLWSMVDEDDSGKIDASEFAVFLSGQGTTKVHVSDRYKLPEDFGSANRKTSTIE